MRCVFCASNSVHLVLPSTLAQRLASDHRSRIRLGNVCSSVAILPDVPVGIRNLFRHDGVVPMSFLITQNVRFEGPSPPEMRAHTLHIGSPQRMYQREDQDCILYEVRRSILQHAANLVMAEGTREREGHAFPEGCRDVDLGPLGTLKNVRNILSVHFRNDLEIEYVAVFSSEPA